MAESKKPSWPQTPGGTTDWEKVFEDPQIGFIPLIAKAPTPKALRESAIVVIQQLFTRKDDPPEVQHFISELNQIVPDAFPEDKLPLVVQAVSDILRQVKDERKRKAAEFEAEKAKEAADISPQTDVPQKKKKKDRRNPEKAMRIATQKRLAQEKKAKIIRFAGTALILLGIVGGATALWQTGSLEREKLPSEILVEEIYRVAEGEKLEQHSQGGAIRSHVFAGRPAVTVDAVPPDICASAAWQLVNSGSVMINNRMPQRVAPTVLTELCNQYRQGATLTWFPKQKKETKQAF